MNGNVLGFVKNVVIGFIIGIANIIPGVSGGTLAFITGIYERLLAAISSINLELISLFKSEGFSAVWKRIDGTFLVKLLVGMGIGFILGLKLVVRLLETHPVHIWSFFFGLVSASVWMVGKTVEKWNEKSFVSFEKSKISAESLSFFPNDKWSIPNPPVLSISPPLKVKL